jgi:hypothetical protein
MNLLKGCAPQVLSCFVSSDYWPGDSRPQIRSNWSISEATGDGRMIKVGVNRRGVRIFLSSTYIDLVAYRVAAAKALEQLGQQVGRMEIFGARPDEPTKACLGEIDKCSLFVGIYAHRYGFTPEQSQISITEQEFEHARQRRKQIFCFLAEDNHPWPPAFVEDGKARERLQQFKTILALFTWWRSSPQRIISPQKSRRASDDIWQSLRPSHLHLQCLQESKTFLLLEWPLSREEWPCFLWI